MPSNCFGGQNDCPLFTEGTLVTCNWDLGDAVVVTGASGGIGRGIVAHLLSQGARRIACQYRSRLDELTSLLTSYDLDPSAHCFQCDLTDERAVGGFAEAVHNRFKTVRGLVNVAGCSSNGMSWRLSGAEFRRVMDANVTSMFMVNRCFVPAMRAQRSGSVINISSIVGVTGAVGAAHYSASKAAVIGLTKSMALELASSAVTVNAVAPGYFDTGLIHSVPEPLQEQIRGRIPLGRLGEASEVGEIVAFLIGDGARYVTGQVIHVNGGMF